MRTHEIGVAKLPIQDAVLPQLKCLKRTSNETQKKIWSRIMVKKK